MTADRIGSGRKNDGKGCAAIRSARPHDGIFPKMFPPPLRGRKSAGADRTGGTGRTGRTEHRILASLRWILAGGQRRPHHKRGFPARPHHHRRFAGASSQVGATGGTVVPFFMGLLGLLGILRCVQWRAVLSVVSVLSVVFVLFVLFVLFRLARAPTLCCSVSDAQLQKFRRFRSSGAFSGDSGPLKWRKISLKRRSESGE